MRPPWHSVGMLLTCWHSRINFREVAVFSEKVKRALNGIIQADETPGSAHYLRQQWHGTRFSTPC